MNVAIFLSVFIVLIGAVVWVGKNLLSKRAQGLGHASVRDYLYSIPSTDLQKEDAVDLALKGLVITSLGLLFAPLLFIGLLPAYYGFRKVMLMNARFEDRKSAE